MYIGAFIDAMPIPSPPINLNITSSVTDCDKNEGSPDPQAEIVNKTAESISETFLP